MSDRPERVFAGLASKNPTEYIREDIVQEMLEQHAAEARGDTFECPYCGTVTKWQLKDATGESDER